MDDLQAQKHRLCDELSMHTIMVCTIEEVSELTKVCTKFMRGDDKFMYAALTEEIAHVLLMVDALRCKCGISQSEVAFYQREVFTRREQVPVVSVHNEYGGDEYKSNTTELKGENQNG